MRTLSTLLVIAALLPAPGCADAHYEPERASFKSAAAPPPAAGAIIPAEPPAVGATSEAPATAAAAPPGVTRKVIYDATLDLAVESLEPAAARVAELVGSSGGYIAEETLAGSPGSARSQFWRLRIPVEAFDGFVRSVTALGELVQFNRKSQDVTAEFYDVEARIRNKQVQEQTLQKILEERSGQLEEVLKVEVELSRVRGEIEQMQGRLRVLQNLSSLATLTLNIRERERFEPAAPVVADFPTQVSRTFQASVTQLVDLGKGLVLFAAAQAPWVPLWIVGLLVAWAVGRRLAPLARRLAAPVAAAPTGGPPSAGA